MYGVITVVVLPCLLWSFICMLLWYRMHACRVRKKGEGGSVLWLDGTCTLECRVNWFVWETVECGEKRWNKMLYRERNLCSALNRSGKWRQRAFMGIISLSAKIGSPFSLEIPRDGHKPVHVMKFMSWWTSADSWSMSPCSWTLKFLQTSMKFVCSSTWQFTISRKLGFKKPREI